MLENQTSDGLTITGPTRTIPTKENIDLKQEADEQLPEGSASEESDLVKIKTKLVGEEDMEEKLNGFENKQFRRSCRISVTKVMGDSLILAVSFKNNPSVEASKGNDCSSCDKSYVYKKDLDRHQKRHKLATINNNNKEESITAYNQVQVSKGFDCPDCGNSYIYKKCLERHQKHTCGQTTFLDCPVYGKKIKQQFTLNDHIKLLHGDYYKAMHPPKNYLVTLEDISGPAFVCHKCSKQYRYRNGLMRHLMLECGLDPHFQCHVCSKRIRRLTTLKKQLVLMHEIDE